MNDKLTFTGGEPFMREDDFLRIQKSNREFIQTLFKGYGECIISGANTNDPAAGNDLIVSDDGYIYLNGEVLKVDAGTYPFVSTNSYWEYKKVTTYETGGDKVYKDGTVRQTWQKNRAVPVNVSSLSNLDAVNGVRWRQIKTKRIEIGPWDMTDINPKVVAHGIANYKKIISISAFIWDDAEDVLYPQNSWISTLSRPDWGIGVIDSTSFFLDRLTGGYFDSVYFNNDTINRGYVYIKYED